MKKATFFMIICSLFAFASAGVAEARGGHHGGGKAAVGKAKAAGKAKKATSRAYKKATSRAHKATSRAYKAAGRAAKKRVGAKGAHKATTGTVGEQVSNVKMI